MPAYGVGSVAQGVEVGIAGEPCGLFRRYALPGHPFCFKFF